MRKDKKEKKVSHHFIIIMTSIISKLENPTQTCHTTLHLYWGVFVGAKGMCRYFSICVSVQLDHFKLKEIMFKESRCRFRN